VVGARLLELNSEFSDLFLEVQELLLDVSSFLVLKGQDSFFDGAESALRNFNELGLAVLKLNKEVFFHLDTVLLEEHNSLFHGLNLVESTILDHLNITEVSHDLHENLLLALGLAALWDHLDAVGNLIDELLDIVNFSYGIGEKEGGVGLNPL